MKFNAKPKLEVVAETHGCWHPWFAWFPVPVGGRSYAWLETVRRKGRLSAVNDPFTPYWLWEYLPLNCGPNVADLESEYGRLLNEIMGCADSVERR